MNISNQCDKKSQRQYGYDARNLQQNKDEISQVICEHFFDQPEYRNANWVMCYLHCRTEVRTIAAVIDVLAKQNKQIVIPYCTKDDMSENKLGLWLLEDFSELVPGMWGILEPPKSRWGELGKEVEPGQLDLIMVPGVTFDRSGGRLGNGAGYYDRLLNQVRVDTVLTGVCFQAQIIPQVIMHDHDVSMDYVITEKMVYKGRGHYDQLPG
jgi:5-formyltetrahydrofolate cyclo-ligase